MSARTRHRWLAWLLPLIVLRTFLPVGFMLSWTEGGLQVVLCSGTGPLAAQSSTAQTAAHAHHAHHHEHHADSTAGTLGAASQAHEGSLCPFAAAGSSSAPAYVAAFITSTTVALAATAFRSDAELSSVPIPIDRIRGPPLA